MGKLRVGVLCGGQSPEHEVALQSAANIVAALNREKYEVSIIGITKQGKWVTLPDRDWLLEASDAARISLNERGAGEIVVKPWSVASIDETRPAFDVVVPVLHGPRGEDGSIQGFLTLAGIPYVGSGILGSAVGMDKDVMKRLLREAGLPIARFRTLREAGSSYSELAAELGSTLFVKPANMGSSVGVSRVTSSSEFNEAVREAFRFDQKILVEEFIAGREIECAVLGNRDVRASIPGELRPTHDFYSYQAKYIDSQGAIVEIPASLSAKLTKEVQDLAVEVFKVLECRGLARVDFFLTPDDQWVVNEINTFPGFTSISMYPKMWEASGVPVGELLDILIKLALEQADAEAGLEHSYRTLA
jgi:D-alanine-D-alanine ligase